ncbi:Oidioi.mRNA.OKI2018_I69.XSR.g16774.t1.cds [Oikopleura dioica]|uniref:Oidioi.mRNA.OKI2018_I69.XSR.g16774.t1.cds n=1 Tax=Oikopleura dioica TaxID=34765 RepID=A0ABN7SMB1_OIKDI|nr:Oidioi.mRNA.OKI2018_I69.XSR.g16774.t1.cds [Oikopleura dioica]
MDDNWKERRVGYNLNMATNSIQVANVNYEHPVDFSMEDTCTVVFHGKTHFFGGFRNPRRFATLQNCRVVPNSYGLRYPHIDGIYGSCAVHANAVFMCFGNESAPLANRCQMWREGQEGMDEPTTANEHDWAAMVSFNKKLLVVGGCSKNGPGCNGAVETYQAGDYDGWTSLTAHPATAGIFGHGLTTDGESVFLFGGMTKSLGADSYNQSVWRFRNNTWSEIGTLQQVASGAVVSTAFQMGRFAFSGEIYLEKFNLVGDNVQSTRIDAPDTDDMEMYYSSFLYTDEPICL